MRKLRFGVLSTAKIGVQKVLPAIMRSQRCELVALASREEERGRKVAEQLGIPRVHGSYQALLEDRAVDAVYIPLPNHMHAPWTIAAASAGKHVLCEKPLARSAAEARTMVDAVEKAGVKLMEAFMYRFHPTWRKVNELVAAGAIGEIRAMQGWFSYFNNDPHNIRNVAQFGGGALMDIGCYPVNVARMLFGSEPTRVHAAVRRHPSYGTDMMTSVLLEFGNRHATFTCSTLTEPCQSVRIAGSRGRIEVDIPFNIPPDLPTRIHLVSGGNPPVAPATTMFTFEPADQYSLQADAFAAAVLSGGPVPTPPSDAVANMAVIEAILAAAG